MNMPEPYRIKMVEPIRLIPREQRESVLKEANYNLFQIPAGTVFIDLLTDSGTGAMSSDQWAAMMLGDESYAGSKSYFQLRDAVNELFGFPYVLPCHQGRGAENVFFTTEITPGDIVPSNAHFDTTRANLEWLGAKALDLPAGCAHNPQSDCLFKGNMATSQLLHLLESESERVPFVMLTVTNNRAAGQPVSMENIKRVSEICHAFQKPLIIDACRHAENAFLIKKRDPSYKQASLPSIIQAFFSHADGMLMSAKKDGLANIGGFLAVREEDLFERLNNMLILKEGFTTYGGLAGRDLAAVAVGLWEAVQEDYLAHRMEQVEFLGKGLQEQGVPIYTPLGGHAVYVDTRRFFNQDIRELPGQSLAASLYIEGGVRACDLGGGMFGKDSNGLNLELMRLAIPRRTYTESHLRYVANVFEILQKQKQKIPNLRCVQKPEYLGHFTAKYDLQEEEVPRTVQH